MDKRIVEYTSPYGIFFQHRLMDEYCRVKSSSHLQYEIMLLLSGEVKAVVNGKNYTLNAGDLIIIDIHEFHSMEMYEKVKTELYVTNFTPEILPSYVHLKFTDYCKNNPAFAHKIPAEFVKKSEILSVMERINKTLLKDERKYLETFITAELIRLVAEVNIVLDDFAGSGAFNVNEGTDNHMINSCVAYINDNITKDISIDDIAKNNFVSRSYLQHSFKKIFGVSVSDFILNQKMALARYLLITGLSPTKVALQLGFQYYTTFYAKFKKFYGFSPKRLNVSAIVSKTFKE